MTLFDFGYRNHCWSIVVGQGRASRDNHDQYVGDKSLVTLSSVVALFRAILIGVSVYLCSHVASPVFDKLPMRLPHNSLFFIRFLTICWHRCEAAYW